MATKHEFSGALGSALIITPLITTALALVLSLIYAYILVWSPIAGYVNLLFVGGFAFGLAMAVVYAVRQAKCRNQAVAMLAGAWTGLVALYASWAFFVFALVSRFSNEGVGMLDVFLQPVVLWEFILNLNADGWYEIFGGTPSGGLLWGLWGIEALIILGGAVLGGFSAFADVSFCESCNVWTEDAPFVGRRALPSEGTSAVFSAENLQELEALPAPEEGLVPHLRLKAQQCPGCHSFTTAQLELVQYVEDDGKISEKVDKLGGAYVYDAGEVSRMQALA